MLLLNIFFCVLRSVVRKSLIFKKESSYPFYTVRLFSNLNYSLSVLNWCLSVLGVPKKSKNTVLVMVLKIKVFQAFPSVLYRSVSVRGILRTQ